MSKLKRLLCYESQHQSQSNEKSLVQFDYEKAVFELLRHTEHLELESSSRREYRQSVIHPCSFYVLDGGDDGPDLTRAARDYWTLENRITSAHKAPLSEAILDEIWPLHDVDITNIVWCMAYKGGVVYCTIAVQ